MSRRVVSLVPSSTETLLALGADVVACTRFCEQPHVRHVGGTKNPDIEAIVALAPDVVVVDREENRVEDHDELVAAGIEVLATQVVDVASALDVVAQLAASAGVVAPERPRSRPPDAVPVRTAFVPIWRRPWMTISAATYGASVLRCVGVELVAVVSSDDYPTVHLDTIQDQRPDLVLVPSEPYDFRAEHIEELVAAFPGSDVRMVDGRDLFWWGVRTPAAITRLGAALGRPPTR